MTTPAETQAVKTGAASSCITVRRPKVGRSVSAFTLVEVMIALTIVTMMMISAFGGMKLVSNLALRTAIRAEADRLLQDEAEQLMSVDFSTFAASADQTITSTVKTTFTPGTESQFQYPTATSGRVTYTRRVVAVSSTSTTKTLRVEVQWTWQGNTTTISTPVYKSM